MYPSRCALELLMIIRNAPNTWLYPTFKTENRIWQKSHKDIANVRGDPKLTYKLVSILPASLCQEHKLVRRDDKLLAATMTSKMMLHYQPNCSQTSPLQNLSYTTAYTKIGVNDDPLERQRERARKDNIISELPPDVWNGVDVYNPTRLTILFLGSLMYPFRTQH